LLEALKANGWEPRDFELGSPSKGRGDWYAVGDPNQTRVADLVHRPSGYYFEIIVRGGIWRVLYEPGEHTPRGGRGWGDWQGVVEEGFLEWLNHLRREVEARDVWSELRDESALLVDAPRFEQNTPFNLSEQVEIRLHLAEAKEIARADPTLTAAQFAAVEQRLEYLADAVDRLGRVDWREAFVGALVGLLVQGVANTALVREILRYVGNAVGYLFGPHIPQLP
jgi:hypothetical protein